MSNIQLATSTVFERHEKKYLLSPLTYKTIVTALRAHMCEDQYGQYTVCSLYFDTDDYRLVRKSIEKPAYKEKLRLRSYGVPQQDDTVFLELKKKLAGVTYKRRVPMTCREVEAYLRYGSPPPYSGQILSEIEWFMQQYWPGPKVVLCYDRIALHGADDQSLRITFDTDIRWRMDSLDLSQGDHGARLLSPGERLMEIKVAGAFPCWLASLLSRLKIYPVSFSKYGMVYRNHLREEVKYFAY